eukprot:3199089-Amphidinium_carterae.1
MCPAKAACECSQACRILCWALSSPRRSLRQKRSVSTWSSNLPRRPRAIAKQNFKSHDACPRAQSSSAPYHTGWCHHSQNDY